MMCTEGEGEGGSSDSVAGDAYLMSALQELRDGELPAARALLGDAWIAYEAAGGPSLRVEDLSLRFDMSLALSLQGQGGVPAQLYRRIKRDEWASVKSFTKDPRVDGDGDDAFLVRSYLGNVLYRVTRWKRDGVYARLCAWAGEPPATGS